jgi:hypothetical protein
MGYCPSLSRAFGARRLTIPYKGISDSVWDVLAAPSALASSRSLIRAFEIVLRDVLAAPSALAGLRFLIRAFQIVLRDVLAAPSALAAPDPLHWPR